MAHRSANAVNDWSRYIGFTNQLSLHHSLLLHGDYILGRLFSAYSVGSAQNSGFRSHAALITVGYRMIFFLQGNLKCPVAFTFSRFATFDLTMYILYEEKADCDWSIMLSHSYYN